MKRRIDGNEIDQHLGKGFHKAVLTASVQLALLATNDFDRMLRLTRVLYRRTMTTALEVNAIGLPD